ncbi:porin domain protein [Brucella rhizosphaerae]|uniref:Porin domain protein n=1 Tax=Brucella rhizosphaerae TaxID=571254 RepID=A0A256FVZ3_9HYPH|nr:porin domain protein [Brucella rhizosphaerae]
MAGLIHAIDNFHGKWDGDYTPLGGATYIATDKAITNAELASDEANTFYATTNVVWHHIISEACYVHWHD